MNNEIGNPSGENALVGIMKALEFEKLEGTENLTGPEIYSKFGFIFKTQLVKEQRNRLEKNPKAVLAKNKNVPDMAFILNEEGPFPLPHLLPVFKEAMRRQRLSAQPNQAPEGSLGGTEASVAQSTSP